MSAFTVFISSFVGVMIYNYIKNKPNVDWQANAIGGLITAVIISVIYLILVR